MEGEVEGKPECDERKPECEEGENENLSGSDTVILQLLQKNAKLKKKLSVERKMGEIKLFFFHFILGFYCHTLCSVTVKDEL